MKSDFYKPWGRLETLIRSVSSGMERWHIYKSPRDADTASQDPHTEHQQSKGFPVFGFPCVIPDISFCLPQ